MKKILTITFIFFTQLLFAQEPLGNWYGVLEVAGSKIRLNFHIKSNGTGLVSTMDSPDQGANGIPTDTTIIDGNKISIIAKKLNLRYGGVFNNDFTELNGTFKQGITSLPLIFFRNPGIKENTVKARPQDPIDFPYKQEDLEIKNINSGITLSATLTTPIKGEISKIVVLISGSGPQNRNEELLPYNHRPFLVWSDFLTRNGIAILRYDDRGVGKSSGNFSNATTLDFADDAESVVKFIKSRKDLSNLKVGLLGHSEGGMIAPMVANRDKDVDFVILLAGPGIPIAKLMVHQNSAQMKLSGMPDSAIASNAKLNEQIYAASKRYKDLDAHSFKIKIDSALSMLLNKYQATDTSNEYKAQNKSSMVDQIATPWFRYFITADPQEYLSKLKCPVLAINGALDMQVPSKLNLDGIEKSLTLSGNKKFEIFEVPDLNHLMQKVKTGSVREYGESEETVNPIVLNKVLSWLNAISI